MPSASLDVHADADEVTVSVRNSEPTASKGGFSLLRINVGPAAIRIWVKDPAAVEALGKAIIRAARNPEQVGRPDTAPATT
jgi:hypothetical protein